MLERNLSGVKVLLISSFFIPLGSFLILPFLPVYLSKNLSFSFTTIGIILAFTTFIQFGGGFLGGLIAEKFGLKNTMVFALFLRTLGFFLLFISVYYPYSVFLSLFCISLGGAFYLPANKAYIVENIDPRLKARYLSYSNSALNAGMAIGPLLASFFILNHPKPLFIYTTLSFFTILMIHVFLMPKESMKSEKKSSGLFNFNSVLLDLKRIRLLLLYSVFGFYFYFFFQNYLSVYMLKEHTPFLFSLLLIFNSLIIIFFQPLFSEKIKNSKYKTVVFLSFSLFFIAYILLFFSSVIFLIFLSCFAISFAETFLFLKNDLEILKYIEKSSSIAFGYQRLFAGMGSFISSVIGGYLYGFFAKNGQEELFWICIACQVGAFLIVLTILNLREKFKISKFIL